MKIFTNKTVVINGFRWTISEVDVSPVKNTNGCCYYNTCHVYIERDLQPSQNFKHTLIHELTHAFIWSFGFHDTTFNKETVCNFIGANLEAIHAIFTAYMKGRKKK